MGQRLGGGGRERRRSRSLGNVLAAGEPAGVDRRHQRLEIGLPCELAVQSLQPLRGPDEEWRGITPAPQSEGHLGPHPLHLGTADLVQRSDLGRHQESLRDLEISRRVGRPR